MKGLIYRTGTAVKRLGERMGRAPVLRFFCWWRSFCGCVIRAGLAVRGLV